MLTLGEWMAPDMPGLQAEPSALGRLCEGEHTPLAGAGSAPWQGTLQWTYVWAGGTPSSSSERSLQVDFAAKAADQWSVNSWGWSNY